MEPPVYAEIKAHRGQNATLPCVLRSVPAYFKVKWSKVEPPKTGVENIVLISNGHGVKHYGKWQSKASLRRNHVLDISLRLTKLELQDYGLYQCELINGIYDESVTIALNIEGTGTQILTIQYNNTLITLLNTVYLSGVVFPYQSRNGRYKFTYSEAEDACAKQDAILATYTQLYRGNNFYMQYLAKECILSHYKNHLNHVFIGILCDRSTQSGP